MNLDGAVVVVTGGARRVGRAIAAAAARKGARVVVHYNRSREEAATLARDLRRSYGRETLAVRADLESVPQIERMAKAIGKRFGRVDLLVNNASTYERNDFGRTTQRDWDFHMNANARAPFFVTQALLPWLRKSEDALVVNIADWAALRPYADYIPYCASKAALLSMNSSLAKALAPEIRVNAVLPGPVLLPERFSPETAAAVKRATLLKKLGTPEDVVKAVLFFAESAEFSTGAQLTVDGGRLIA